MLTLADVALMLEQHNEEREEEWSKVRYLAWASLKPYSDKNLKPEDLIKLAGDERRMKKYFDKQKAEGRLASLRKQTPEEQNLMERLTRKK